jgi:thiol-disulfide isomerase/thioredoxin
MAVAIAAAFLFSLVAQPRVARTQTPPNCAQQLQINCQGILSFEGNTGWVNSPPLTPADLEHNTTLVDFFEYTCINCLRTLPYLKEWYKRYHKYGFEIISIQAPEFGFSGDRANVEAAAKRLGITWPIVIDANDAIWNRYHNDVWPHEFVFTPGEYLKESQEGEGNYPTTEHLLQVILKITHPGAQLPPVMALLPQDNYDVPGAVCYPKTAEMVGWHEDAANTPANADARMATYYADPGGNLEDGKVYLQGDWHKTKDSFVSDGGNGYFATRYHAIEVMVVMRPVNGHPIRVAVTQDGKPVPREDAGSDVRYDANGNSYIDVDTGRAYEVIYNKAWGNHDLRLAPDGANLGIYDVAFESCQVPGSH